MTDKIIVVPYDSDWPNEFENEAGRIKKALGVNCHEIHHIGSTSIYGLKAKPIIDILSVVKNLDSINIDAMKALGYESKGEYGVAFRSYFQKGNPRPFNVHIYQVDDPEITRHLQFRDWLRENDEDAKRYELIKVQLADKFPLDLKQYCMGKSAFVDNIISKSGFEGYRMVQALMDSEWEAVKYFRKRYFFSKNPDPLILNLKEPNHIHFVLYKNTQIAGYCHLQLWQDYRAALRIIVIDEPFRHQGLGTLFLSLCERWLKQNGYRQIVTLSHPDSYSFYLRRGYSLIPFKDPEGLKTDPHDIEMGKHL